MPDCGCRVAYEIREGEERPEWKLYEQVPVIVYCPLHAAAPRLAEAARRAVEALERQKALVASDWPPESLADYYQALDGLRAALALVEAPHA